MDFAEVARRTPQFGKSTANLLRSARSVFPGGVTKGARTSCAYGQCACESTCGGDCECSNCGQLRLGMQTGDLVRASWRAKSTRVCSTDYTGRTSCQAAVAPVAGSPSQAVDRQMSCDCVGDCWNTCRRVSSCHESAAHGTSARRRGSEHHAGVQCASASKWPSGMIDLQVDSGRASMSSSIRGKVAESVRQFRRLSDRVRRRDITDKQAHCRLSCFLCAAFGPLNSYAAGLLKEAWDELPGGSGWDPEDIAADEAGLGCCGTMGCGDLIGAFFFDIFAGAIDHCETCCA